MGFREVRINFSLVFQSWAVQFCSWHAGLCLSGNISDVLARYAPLQYAILILCFIAECKCSECPAGLSVSLYGAGGYVNRAHDATHVSLASDGALLSKNMSLHDEKLGLQHPWMLSLFALVCLVMVLYVQLRRKG